MELNFNKVWGFGCSFMYGTTIEPHDPEWVRDTVGWGGIIGQEFDRPSQSCAVSGFGNQDIVNHFFKILPDIKKDDLVIISWSNPHRFYYADPKWTMGSINSLSNFDCLELPDRLKQMLIAQREIALLYEEDIVRQQLDHIILIQEVCKSRGIKVCQNNSLVDVTKDIDMDNASDHIISRHLSVDRENFWCYNQSTLTNLLGLAGNNDPLSGNVRHEDKKKGCEGLWSEPDSWHHPSAKGHRYISKTLSEWIKNNDNFKH
jgi:hypothetical protein